MSVAELYNAHRYHISDNVVERTCGHDDGANHKITAAANALLPTQI